MRAPDTVARASHGWDNGKKVNGRKRHIAVAVLGLLLAVVVTPASVQDRDGARPLLWHTHTFQVLPRRWVVERTFAWISKHRRCVRDYERLPEHHEAVIKWAMIALMARRLACGTSAAQPARAALVPAAAA